MCAFIDAEHAFDAAYARNLGVNLEELLVSQPDTGEQALEIAETLIRSNAIDVVVIDSVAALVPKAEILGRDGRLARRPARPAHEPGAAQAQRRDPLLERRDDLHEPDPHEDRRDVRQPRDDHGRQRAQVLRVGAARHAPHRHDQGRRATSCSATARASRS